MPFEGERIELDLQQRSELDEIARSRSLPAGFVLRAKILLLLADGSSYDAIKEKLDTTAPTISRWKKRFLELGLDGLETHRPGQPPSKLTPRLRAKILDVTRRKPADGSTHWSCRKLAKHLGLSKDLVHRVWREADLKPHRLERYMASNDPDFEPRPPTSSAFTSTRRGTPPCSASTKRPPFRRSTAATACCRCRPDAPSATASSTSATARSRSTPP
jgi:transposase